MRETLFNWLQRDIHDARCLDLFAGSGALGLEAISRGASAVVFVEHNRQAAGRLMQHIATLDEAGRAEVKRRDALKLLQTQPRSPFDIVFVDPPFGDRMLPAVCRLLEDRRWLADPSLVYLEQDAQADWPVMAPGWRPLREARAGQSIQRLLQRSNTR